jgi:hypothetical protein
VQKLDGKANTLGLADTSFGIPGRVRLGDLDADGYPEIILTESYKEGTSVLNATYVYTNAPCSAADNCGGQADKRHFIHDPSTDYNKLN